MFGNTRLYSTHCKTWGWNRTQISMHWRASLTYAYFAREYRGYGWRCVLQVVLSVSLHVNIDLRSRAVPQTANNGWATLSRISTDFLWDLLNRILIYAVHARHTFLKIVLGQKRIFPKILCPDINPIYEKESIMNDEISCRDYLKLSECAALSYSACHQTQRFVSLQRRSAAAITFWKIKAFVAYRT